MNTTHKILITGAGGYVGAMLVQLFAQRPDVEAIIGIDMVDQPDLILNIPKLTYIKANTSDSTWQETARSMNPDIVIHTAWQIREMYGKKKLQWKWNIDGSDAIFDFAFGTPSVKKLIHFSTVASYSARPDNTIEHRFTEEEPFRTSDYLYAEEKRITEQHLEEKYAEAQKKGSKVQVAIIRPAAITGPRGRYMRIRFGLQSALSGQLKASFIHRVISLMVSFVPVTEKWCRQFIHEDDIVDIVTLLAFGQLKNGYDIFNACPPGDVVRGIDMAQAVGKKAIRIHPWLIRIAFACMWNLTRGRVPTSRGGWKSYSYPIVVDGSKVTRMYGYQYKWQSKDAFVKKEGRYMKYVA
ncbi:MAG: NAD-dependent epimerase/dehydratase family protein [Candidatus Taylorbacteria bacterium]